MAVVPFGEWLPDQPDFANPGSATITNVLPRSKQSYGPMPGLVPYSGALNGRCQGAYPMRDPAGNVFIFAGDGGKLYLLKAGSTNFGDVSKVGGYSTPAAPNGFWSMTSFGARVIATNFINPAQTFLAGTDSAFSDLSTGAPKAQYAAVIRDFLFLGNTVDGSDGARPFRLWWSAIGDPTNFPVPGTNAAVQVQSDFQDLEQTDLGQVTGIVGGGLSAIDGAAFCERGIYRIAYAGSPNIFDFAVAQGAAGTNSPLSIVVRRFNSPFSGAAAAVAYYLGTDGYCLFDGSSALSIGAEKMDKAFFKDLDASQLAYVQAVADPINKLIFWVYSGPGNGGLYNRAVVFNWSIGRWALIDLTMTPVEWATPSFSIGYTLEQLDQIGTLDALPFSLDSRIWTGGVPVLGMFDNSHKLNYTTGPNMAPTVETSEQQLFPGFRAKIASIRPIVDGTPASVAVGGEHGLQPHPGRRRRCPQRGSEALMLPPDLSPQFRDWYDRQDAMIQAQILGAWDELAGHPDIEVGHRNAGHAQRRLLIERCIGSFGYTP